MKPLSALFFKYIISYTKNVLEIGTNNAALSIFLQQRSEDIKIDAIEIQKEAINLAKYNLKINNLEKTINTNSVTLLSQETLQKSEYKCTPQDVKINKVTGRVCEVNFTKIIP